jgi:hypothetical protein
MRSRSSFSARIVCVFVLLGGIARADQIRDLSEQLKSDASDRVRLSAALSLTKLGDLRAVSPLAYAVQNDSNDQVRIAAAVGLGKIVTPSSSASYKKIATSALSRAVEDPNASSAVKDAANKSLIAITGTGAGTGSGSGSGGGGGGGGIYVNIGPMSSKTGTANDPKFQSLMVTTATKTVATKAQGKMSTSWPGGTPSKAALAAKNAAGFYVDGTLDKLAVKTTGSGSTVTCKISMLLAEFPSKSMFGFLNGGATVTAGASQRDQDLAAQDCVQAVVEDLVSKKIIPTICTKATCQ